MAGGGLVMLSVPLPVISRLLSLTCASPEHMADLMGQSPGACAAGYRRARPAGWLAQPLS
jgi:hypothetical protein